MIKFLRGILVSASKNEVVIDVNGVGYQVSVSKKVMENLPDINGTIQLTTYFDVKENSMSLFGFYDEREREIFRMLITVNGISTKTAHTILSHSGFGDIIGLITGSGGFSGIKIPGVGPKKIEMISIALKDKVFRISGKDEEGVSGDLSEGSREEQSRLEALNALVSLGYSRAEAEKLIRGVLKQNQGSVLGTEEIIRKSLELI